MVLQYSFVHYIVSTRRSDWTTFIDDMLDHVAAK